MPFVIFKTVPRPVIILSFQRYFRKMGVFEISVLAIRCTALVSYFYASSYIFQPSTSKKPRPSQNKSRLAPPIFFTAAVWPNTNTLYSMYKNTQLFKPASGSDSKETNCSWSHRYLVYSGPTVYKKSLHNYFIIFLHPLKFGHKTVKHCEASVLLGRIIRQTSELVPHAVKRL